MRGVKCTLFEMESRYPMLNFDFNRDAFVVGLRWVSTAPSKGRKHDVTENEAPKNQGIRVELALNRNSVLGPTIVYRRDLDAPLYLLANRARCRQILSGIDARGSHLDLQLIIHGSIANAPYAALYQVADYQGEAISHTPINSTPLLQMQPSTPGEYWHVAGQSNLRVRIKLEGKGRHLDLLP